MLFEWFGYMLIASGIQATQLIHTQRMGCLSNEWNIRVQLFDLSGLPLIPFTPSR